MTIVFVFCKEVFFRYITLFLCWFLPWLSGLEEEEETNINGQSLQSVQVRQWIYFHLRWLASTKVTPSWASPVTTPTVTTSNPTQQHPKCCSDILLQWHPTAAPSHYVSMYSNIPLQRHPTAATSHWSDIPLQQPPTAATSHCSDIILQRHPTAVTSHYSNIPLQQHPTAVISHYIQW